MSDIAIRVENVKKQYRLGAIGGGTLTADLQSWWARRRGKEDPNTKIGVDQTRIGERFYALDDISFEVKKGEAVGIIGSNGAGKSTLLKLLSRVTTPTEGKICINGRIASMLEVGTGFHPELTGRENIYMNGATLGMTKAEIDEKIEDIIDFSECRQFIDTPVKRYSSGMYVKLAFAVAAHLDSDIMIMDEVLAVGDVSFQRKCLNKMRGLAQKEGKTILYVSHNMSTIKRLCNRTIVLNRGKLLFDGKSDEAIEVYAGKVIKMQLFNDLDYERNDPEITEIVKIKSLEILERKNNYIKAGEKIKFKLKYDMFDEIPNLYIRCTIMDAGRESVATSVSADLLKLSKKNECVCEIDISSLAPGKYIGQIVLFELLGKGIQKRHDYVPQAVSFEVIHPEEDFLGFDWNIYWGKISLPDMLIQ